MPLPLVPDQGVFTKRNKDTINSNFAELTQPDVWVRPQYGNNLGNGSATYPLGSYQNPYASMSGLAAILKPGMVVGLEGVLLEEYSTPIINDVTILGLGTAGNPRQATTSSIPNGGGSTWLSPSGGTGSLLKINGQGWRVEGIYFNNTATDAATACIELVGGGDPPASADAGHTVIRNNVLTGEANGIYINGGPGFLTIEGNKIFYFDSSGDCGILAGGSGGTGWGTVVRYNNFTANLTHLKPLAAAYGWQVYENRFSYIDVGVTTTSQIDFTGGSNNSVHHNNFDIPYSTNGITAMFVLGTNDRWYANAFSTAVTTTNLSWGQPSS